jgi:tetratricopeptide (TPR) repeat protein
MVLLKLGKLDDALAAYDKAVAHGTGADSLFGRAIVYDRKGDHGHSQADASAARKLDPDIDDEFAQYYGLKLDRAPAVATAGH